MTTDGVNDAENTNILDQLEASFRMPDGIQAMSSKDAKKKAKKNSKDKNKESKTKKKSKDKEDKSDDKKIKKKKKKKTSQTTAASNENENSDASLAAELGLTLDDDSDDDEDNTETENSESAAALLLNESTDQVGELHQSSISTGSIDLSSSPSSSSNNNKKKGASTKKKKGKKSEQQNNMHESILGMDGNFMSPTQTPSSKKKKASGEALVPLLESPTKSPGDGSRKKLSSTTKYSVEYFNTILDDVGEKCSKKIKFKQSDRDNFAQACGGYYETWMNNYENERWLDDLLARQEKQGPDGIDQEELKAAYDYVENSNEALPKHKRHCMHKALKLFEQIDEDKMDALEDKLVKGAIVAQAKPETLAEFAGQSKQNEKLLKRLFNDPKLMKEMLRHGGASKYKYGEAMRIYVECLGEDFLDQEIEERKQKDKDKKSKNKKKEKNKNGDTSGDDDDDDSDEDSDSENRQDYEDEEEYKKATEKWLQKAWGRVNKKIALACALELCNPVFEFDTMTPVDPVERYKHYEEAHKSGQLDPAFPYFSVWEMRQIINSDAPNDQLKWCREMVFNYVPHLTCLTDLRLRYVYMLQSDVRIRKPDWTRPNGTPRTYQMVLSGGGNESINSWFGRFLLKSFGLPSWGTKHRRKEGFTMWTHDGWEAMNGADWETATWQGKSGTDFKTEIEARNKAPPEEYFKKLVTLQCLADVIDEGDPSDIPDYELDVLHPNRLWRSMSVVSLQLLFQTEPEVERTFERKGRGLVETRCQKYLKKFELDAADNDIFCDPDIGFVTIPASRHGFTDGNIIVVESYDGGKQFNFIADGAAEYDFPEDAPETKKYKVTVEVCTVSSKQTPLTISVGARRTPIKVPYTKGVWKFTDPVEMEIPQGAVLKVQRSKGSLGVAIKQFVFE
eukprot:CAMPEP_0113484376 /NCGR_PEP_ID=MMETSP0014_2-20120614/23929_1 /TAXON_ID=2857 /ORGANISM="Nitzschia sp." /LENGTH=903 /DNA_ID=CAMNT_0000377975 /DNA_START=243 /DNA_END=2954 /DNA_ORIENTATION=+ /assembly_acc=CAM_ASM_000159